jgi:hypothetical protein
MHHHKNGKKKYFRNYTSFSFISKKKSIDGANANEAYFIRRENL